jgi:hypothetical protein
MALATKQKRKKTRNDRGETRSLWPPEEILSKWDRDAKLKRLLPPLDSTYDFHNLSQAETEALEEAFSDGFGQVSAYGARPQPLPSGIKTGLLKHAFHHKSWQEDVERGRPCGKSGALGSAVRDHSRSRRRASCVPRAAL